MKIHMDKGILITSIITLVSTLFINWRTSSFNNKLKKQTELFKDELEKQNLALKSELTNQEAIFKNELDKKKKIAEIYYEERAKVLQELYTLLVNGPSDIVNLIRFLGKTARKEEWANSEPYLVLYEEVKLNEDLLKKVLLKSSLYLKNEDYITIKKFHDKWGEPVKVIVDLFVLFEKVPDKGSIMFTLSNEFKEFSHQTLEVKKLNVMFETCVKLSNDFDEIANIIKRAIASEEIQ